MGHDKLRKFAENETFSCLLQPSAQELLADGYFHLRDHPVKGHWSEFFSCLPSGSSPLETSGFAGPLPSDDGPLPLTQPRVGPPEKPVCLGYPRVARFPGATAGMAAQIATVAEDGPDRDSDYPAIPLEEVQGVKVKQLHPSSRTAIVLELGCGKGEYTIALAERDPGRNYIGVDIKGARLWKGAKYATEHALPNVAFLRTRVEFITAFFAPGEVSEIWLTFSDPQFRSENSRLSSPLFLERYRSFMKPGGIVHLKTDSRFLYEYTLALCAVNGLRVLAGTTDLYGPSPEEPSGSSPLETSGFAGPLPSNDGPLPLTQPRVARFPGATAGMALSSGEVQPVVREVQTFYERLFLEQGYPITYLSFVLDHDGPYVSPVEAGAFDTEYWRSVEGPRLLFGHDSAETRRQKMKKA